MYKNGGYTMYMKIAIIIVALGMVGCQRYHEVTEGKAMPVTTVVVECNNGEQPVNFPESPYQYVCGNQKQLPR